MALTYPSTLKTKQSLQPGARGEVIHPNMPGYRHQETDNRIDRSLTDERVGEHDTLVGKYSLDDRLPALFRYGYANGYNHIVIPKLRILAVDPFLSLKEDIQTGFSDPAITLANGGHDVDLEIDGTWKKAAQPFELDLLTGKDKNVKTRRPANRPVGVAGRNEYSRYQGAFNGMQPSPIWTDKWVELPLYSNKASAQKAMWSGAYNLTQEITPEKVKKGSEIFRAGILVKSDEDGRFIPSPLNDLDSMIAGATPTKAEMKLIQEEQAQVVGKATFMTTDLLEPGGLKYVQWSQEDIRDFNEFNPYVKRQTYREGEDVTAHSPYGFLAKTNMFEQTLYENNLQMVEGNENYNKRMEREYRNDYGIPGLTDGTNAVKGNLGADLNKTFAGTATDTVNVYVGKDEIEIHGVTEGLSDFFARLNDTNLSKLAISFVGSNATSVPAPIDLSDKKEGFKFGAGTWGTETVKDFLEINYMDLNAGFLRIVVTDKAELEKVLAQCPQGIKISYASAKDGKTGVPTFLDFEGVIGRVRILLTL